MAYTVFLDGVALPVTPSELAITINNKNESVSLINDSEINILKRQGLKTIAFDFLIPQQVYPFAIYSEEFAGADAYLEKLEALKNSCQPFQFIVSRATPAGTGLFNTNIKVSLEDYTIKEAAEQGMDVLISVNLKEYAEYGTKEIQVTIKQKKPVPKPVPPPRPAPPPPPTQRLYTIVSGDCLWDIAAAQLGNPTRWPEIWNQNSGRLQSGNPDLIYPGEVLDLTGL